VAPIGPERTEPRIANRGGLRFGNRDRRGRLLMMAVISAVRLSTAFLSSLVSAPTGSFAATCVSPC
jgi:hypothetical protein